MPETETENQPPKANGQQKSSLKQKAIQGTAWTLFGYGGSQALRLVSNIILTRLLVPEIFGLMALVQTFQRGITLFSDVGINRSIVQNKRGDDPDFLNTAWTIQVIRGGWICLGCILITWPVANFYGDSRLLWLIPIVSLSSLIQGFNSTSLATFNRHMAVGKLTRFQMVIQIVTLIVTIVIAWLTRSIWAIVIGTLFSSFLTMFWSHRLFLGHSNRFAWDRDALKDLLSFGRWIFLSTAITFLATQADKLMLGKLFPLEILGVYTIAYTFADIPTSVMQKINGQVIFPLISKKAHLPRNVLRLTILQKRWLILVMMALPLTFLVSFGDLIILILYDEKYQQAAWMLPILCLGLWPRMLYLTIGQSLLAIGKPVYSAIGNLVKFFYMIVALPLAVQQMGVLGGLIVIAFNDIPNYTIMSYGLWREKLTSIGQDVRATILLLTLVAIVSVIRYILGLGLSINMIL